MQRLTSYHDTVPLSPLPLPPDLEICQPFRWRPKARPGPGFHERSAAAAAAAVIIILRQERSRFVRRVANLLIGRSAEVRLRWRALMLLLLLLLIIGRRSGSHRLRRMRLVAEEVHGEVIDGQAAKEEYGKGSLEGKRVQLVSV